MSVKPDKELLLSNNERSYKAKSRFRNPYDLWQRFDETRNRSQEKSKERERIINLYERKQHRIRRGGKDYYEPNWGIFTDNIDDFIRFFSAIALDRKIWCRIETYIGVEEQVDVLYSDQITNAFHKHCINRWYCKEEDIISAIHDDCFFNKGCLVWESPLQTFPVHVPTEKVFPDTNATTETRSFDLLFIEKQFTAVELYERATDPEYKDLGWNTDATLKALSKNISNLKDSDSQSVIERFRRGGISQIDQDRLISVVYCYVKEYKEFEGDNKEKKGNRISLMVIPKELISLGVQLESVTENPPNLKRSDYLQFVDYVYKDFSEVISLWTSNIKRAYYNSASFANQIYAACRFHDLTTNTLIRAIKRNMRLYMKTGSQDTRKRVETIDPDAEVFLLNQDDQLEQITLRQDVQAVGEFLRGIKGEISSFSPQDFQGTQASPKGYPITRAETNVIAGQLDDSKSLSIKLIISKNREMCCELYRRFINSTTEESECYEGFKRFKAEMKRLRVPDEAWKKDNVDIYPRFNQFAGRASANFATAQALLQATQVKPSSKGEAKAKRDVIASLVNESNVADYEDIAVQFDSELFIIGQENEALDNPFTSPQNVPVTETDNHMLHIQGHLQDYMAKLELGNKLLQMAAQDPSYRKTFFLERAADIINTQDSKGAHITAHFAVVSKDETKQQELRQLEQTFGQAQSQQDQLAAAVQGLQQQFAQQDAKSSVQDQELLHRQRMDELEYNKAKAMNQLDMEKKVSQIQTTAMNNDVKQEQKITHKEQEQGIKVRDKVTEVATKAEKNRLDIQKEQIKNSMAQQKANNEANKEKT